MNRSSNWLIEILIISFLLVSSCNEPSGATENFQVRDQQAALKLGKRLFFDPNLSINKKVSCASCHQPEKSFTDGLQTSNLGVSGNTLVRNTPTLLNLEDQQFFFMDGGAENLESMIFSPLTHPDEMGMNTHKLIKSLSKDVTYKCQFRQAFKKDTMVAAMVLKSLATYVRSIKSQKSRFDSFQAGKVILNESELLGWNLFQSKGCIKCHIPPLFIDHDFHNIGLDPISTISEIEDPRSGRFRVTQKSEDIGKYKTPTLRNLTFTSPYMHDGRLSSLEDVIEHYSSQIKDPSKHHPALRRAKNMNSIEKMALIDFLKTLTDSTVLVNYK